MLSSGLAIRWRFSSASLGLVGTLCRGKIDMRACRSQETSQPVASCFRSRCRVCPSRAGETLLSAPFVSSTFLTPTLMPTRVAELLSSCLSTHRSAQRWLPWPLKTGLLWESNSNRSQVFPPCLGLLSLGACASPQVARRTEPWMGVYSRTFAPVW